MSNYHGDIALGDTIDIQFSTSDANGAAITLAGTPVISAYIGNSTTQITAGITLTVDLDSVTGLHNVRVVATSGNGYGAQTNVSLVITTGTVDGNSVVGMCVGAFSIENRSALRPATAGRTLNVAADGDIGGNVDGSVASVAGAVGSVTGNVGGNVTGSVGSVLGGINTSGGTITTLDGLDTAQDTQHATTQSAVSGVAAAAATAVWAAGTRTLTSFGTLVADAWAAATASLTTAGSIGKALVDWMAAYTTTRAGYLDNLNTGGLVASAADVAGITQAQRVRVIVPASIERPDAGSTTYRVWIYAYDEQHQAEDLDSNPTVTVENNAGTDRSTALGTVTKPTGTGIYYVDYTLDSGDAIEGLVFRITATEGAVATEYAAATLVVDTTAVDFTAADRAKLDTLHDTRIPGVIQPQTGDAFARLGAPAGASVSADIAAVPTAAENRAEMDANSTQFAAIAAKTVNLPADPADASDIAAAFSNLNDLDATAVQTAVNAALVALHLDHLLAVDYDPASKPGTATALLNELVEDDGGISRFSANALEQAPLGGGGGGGITMSTALPGTPTSGTAGDALRGVLNFIAGKRTFAGDGLPGGDYGAYGYQLTIAEFDDAATAWAVFDVDHPTTPSLMVRIS